MKSSLIARRGGLFLRSPLVLVLVFVCSSTSLPSMAQSVSRSSSSTSSSTGAVPARTMQHSPYGYGLSNPYQSSSGFYNNTVGGINYPSFGIPVQINGNLYNIPSGNCNLPMWKAPSGYFYPWAPRPGGFTYAYPMPILIVERNTTAPAPALPPLSVAFTDLDKYIEEAKKEGKIADRDYTNMSQRVKDLKSKERTLRIAGGGTLDSDDEAQLRRDLDQVGSELTWRIER